MFFCCALSSRSILQYEIFKGTFSCPQECSGAEKAQEGRRDIGNGGDNQKKRKILKGLYYTAIASTGVLKDCGIIKEKI